MKKHILYYLSFVLVLASCSDEFTEKPAIGALSDESLANAKGVELLLIGAYSALDGNTIGGNEIWGGANGWVNESITDNAHKGSTDSDNTDAYNLEVFNWTASNPNLLGSWKSLYSGANRANAVIDLISKVEGDYSAELAESRFLRGYFYYNLQIRFGNIPFISEVEFAATEFNQPNPGPIWDAIEADFQYAMDNLPPTQSAKGKPNTYVAHAFMAKAKIQQKKYAEALSLLEAVIGSGEYSLLAELKDNFNSTGENGSESLFAIQFFADSGQSFNGAGADTLNFPQGGPFGSCCGFYTPTQDLANAYKTDANGLPLLDTYNQSDIANDQGLDDADAFAPEAGNLDPRIDYTIGRRGIDYNGWGVHPGQSWQRPSASDIGGPYLPKKNVYQAGDDGLRGTGAWGEQRSGINWHAVRYADVLLLAAEAAVETGDLEKARGYVNQVRERAMNMTWVKDAAGNNAANYVIGLYTAPWTDAAVARKAVRMERRLELGMEGHRLTDLRRYGNMADVMAAYIENESRTISTFKDKMGTYKSHYELFPIPQNAIDLSGGILTQNPGF